MPTLWLCALCSGALAGAPGLSAQEDAAPVFQETVDVRVVNVEVVVTDRQGRRVVGLAPGDFRLLVDGEPVPIEYFTEIRDAEARRSPASAGTATEAAPEPQPAAAAGQGVGTGYLVFIDEYFSVGAHRDFAVERLRDQMALLGPDDQVAVVAFAGGSVEQLCGWSAAPAKLEACLAAALERPTYGLFRVTQRPRRTAGTVSVAGVQTISEVEVELERVVQAALATLRGFPRPAGRRVLILLAGAWPSFDALRRLEAGGWHASDLEILERLAHTANLLGYTVYPLDLPGLRTTGVDVTQTRPAPTSAASPVTHEIVRQSGLRVLADRTGGRALLYADRARPLAAVAEDTRSYYWLGFSPRRDGDDRVHRIEVQVRGPGLRVRAREGFLDLSQAAEQEMLVESALLFGGRPAAGDGDFLVRVGAAEPAGRGRVRRSLTVELPLSRLLFLPRGKQWAADVELRLAVRADRGATSEVLVVPLHLEGPEQPAAAATRSYRVSILLGSGDHDLVVTVRDAISGAVLTSRVKIRR